MKEKISEQSRKSCLVVVMEITCCIFLCCPRQPKYEETCNNCENTNIKEMHFWWETCHKHFGFLLYISVMLMLSLFRVQPKQHKMPKIMTVTNYEMIHLFNGCKKNRAFINLHPKYFKSSNHLGLNCNFVQENYLNPMWRPNIFHKKSYTNTEKLLNWL